MSQEAISDKQAKLKICHNVKSTIEVDITCNNSALRMANGHHAIDANIQVYQKRYVPEKRRKDDTWQKANTMCVRKGNVSETSKWTCLIDFQKA